MAVSARTVRRVLAAAALLLLAVLAGFIGYARYRARAFLGGLPARLGVDLREETDNFTYSQSLKGRTIFTVRAAKELRRKDGQITLKDVGITVYGHAGPGEPDRVDRIRGSQFDYDQATGILTAAGEVFLELEAPGAHGAADGGQQTVHVKTSGLVFDSKARSAHTLQLVEFAGNSLSGHATGAAYDSASGSVTLEHAVEVSGLSAAEQRSEPILLKAAHARLDRLPRDAASGTTAPAAAQNLLTLAEATLIRTTPSGPRTLSARHAVVHLDGEGNPQRTEAQGDVTITGSAPGSVVADRIDVAFNPKGEPQQANLSGGVHLERKLPASVEQGFAAELHARFDAAGQPVHATLLHAVDLTQTTPTGTRRLDADRVELELAQAANGRSELRRAQAYAQSGQRARIQMTGPAPAPARGDSQPAGAVLTQQLSAPTLDADFITVGGRGELRRLSGQGGTTLERSLTAADGRQISREISSGATLQAELAVDGSGGTPSLRQVEQSGEVTVLREIAAGQHPASAITTPSGPTTERAHADRAVYRAADDSLTLSGSVRVLTDDSSLIAERATFDRATGMATAEGSVRVTYDRAASGQPGKPAGGSEPLHVLATRAQTVQKTGVTVFEGTAAQPVRAWQAASQLEAPRMTVDRTQRTLLAEGGAPSAVHAILAQGTTAAGQGKPLRVFSSRLTYADATRLAYFSGGVRLLAADGTLTAADVTARLTASSAAAAQGDTGPAAALLGGKLEEVVATGNVTLLQPGRRATGERLVYTVADAGYLLTGTADHLPRVVDQEHGEVTGASLRFHSGDDSVVVSAGNGQRVHTELPVKH